MLSEVIVDLSERSVCVETGVDQAAYGKALAVERVIGSADPEHTVYLAGYTPLAAAGLGFAGKLNLYGVSLLGGNLQGSRSGGLVAEHLTRLGVLGISVSGETDAPCVLAIGSEGCAELVSLDAYGGAPVGTKALAERIYARHGGGVAVAVTDPSSTGFLYNALVCNSRAGGEPNRAASRGTTVFGRNGLLGVVVERAERPAHGAKVDRRRLTELLRTIHRGKRSAGLIGSSDPSAPLLGGTYGAAAKARFEQGHGLTNLFRNADVPESVYRSLLPETMVQEQVRLAQAEGVRLEKHPCVPGCPNRCVRTVLVRDDSGQVHAMKAGEWETYQGVINLGLFEDALGTSAEILAHSNEFAYDHIEALVTLAALALVSETERDTGVRYGDREAVLSALQQAAQGSTDLGVLIRLGAAAVEAYYGLERHFTVGGHALPFHNGRSMLQTGVGLSWTYGRHGECCAGPGRLNFLGEPYDPTDHGLDPRVHVLNSMHAMVLYGAVDEQGMCFFMGPSVDTLVDVAAVLEAVGQDADPNRMIRRSAGTILAVHDFNAARGVGIQPLPRVFYEQPTHGNAQGTDEAVAFNVPFSVVRDYGEEVLRDVASGRQCIGPDVLRASRARHAAA